MQEKKPRRGIQSVEIAFRILNVLQQSRQAMALKDVARLARLTASAANNYLVSLVGSGLPPQTRSPATTVWDLRRFPWASARYSRSTVLKSSAAR